MEKLKTFPMATDLLLADGLPENSKRRPSGKGQEKEPWSPYFLPLIFAKANQRAKPEDYELSDEQLQNRGVEVSKERQKLRDFADGLMNDFQK